MKSTLNAAVSFFRTKGVAFVWLGAVFAPTLVAIGLVEDKSVHLIAGVCLLLLVFLSIVDGLNALRYRLMANFVGSALVPIASLVVGTLFAVMKYVKVAA